MGTYEHERYISHFEVKVYRDNVLIFAGIINTSALNYNPADGIIKFLCYDKLKLLIIFSDLEQLYILTAGYQPAQILGYMIQKIEQRIPIDISAVYNGFAIPSITIPGDTYAEMLELGVIDHAAMLVLPSGGGYTYSFTGDSWVTPKYGFIVDGISNRVIFVFAHKVYVKAYDATENLATQYQARYLARIYKYHSGFAYVQDDYEDTTDWQGNLFGPTSDSDIAFRRFFSDHGLAEDVYDSLTTYVTHNSTAYHSYRSNNICRVAACGNALPPYIHPGKMYNPSSQDEKTNCLKTLQAVLMMYNATVVASSNGTIQFLSKDPGTGTAIEIADADLVGEIDIHRVNQEVPDTSALEVLYGETKYLKEICKDYLLGFHAGKWQISCTVDNLAKYALTLGANVIIRSQAYNLTEVQRDYENDEYVIKGWR